MPEDPETVRDHALGLFYTQMESMKSYFTNCERGIINVCNWGEDGGPRFSQRLKQIEAAIDDLVGAVKEHVRSGRAR